MLREALELMLERGGCTVTGVAGGYDEGLGLVGRTDPDVAVIDIGLGEDSGIDLARELLRRDPARRIVLYTAADDVDGLIEGLDAGAQGYALKAGGSAELLEAIESVMSGRTYIDPRLRTALIAHRAGDRQLALSVREREILSLLAKGLTGDEVAERLFLSAETVKTHVRNAMSKLRARNRVHAIAVALSTGEIRPAA